MTKILTDKGIEININYFEIEKYCMNEVKKLKDIEDFNEYKKKYNYFNAYFDYIFNKKKYILHEPLLILDTYLYNDNNKYYIIENNKELINKNYFDFSLMNDLCVSIVNNPYHIEEGFFILCDGTILTNNYVKRHLNSAKLILNKYLISSIVIYKKYLNFIKKHDKYFQYHIIDFLTEELGIIYGKRNGIYISIINNNNKITKEQLNTINNMKKYYNVICEDYNNYNKLNKLLYRNR